MGYMTFKEKWRIPRYDDPNETQMGEIQFDDEKCSGCGMCVKACPADVIALKSGQAGVDGTIDCMACGDCVAICKEDAIRLTRNYRYSGFYKTIGYGDLTPPRL